MIAQGKELNLYISSQEPKLRELDDAFQQALYTIPNLISADTPMGASDAENTPLRYVGTPKEFDFKSRDHLELAQLHDFSFCKFGIFCKSFSIRLISFD